MANEVDVRIDLRGDGRVKWGPCIYILALLVASHSLYSR
jgi:hypothetical protein